MSNRIARAFAILDRLPPLKREELLQRIIREAVEIQRADAPSRDGEPLKQRVA